ncbi:MAG: hypothetical protein AB7O91_03140 [Sphingomonas sp.]
MRGGVYTALLLLAACNPGVPQAPLPENEAEPVPNAPAPQPEAAPANEMPPGNETAAAAAGPPAGDPGLAAMSPYRRREYERGWRDCTTGNFDRERQGESYRIGCMAAEEARERRRR